MPKDPTYVKEEIDADPIHELAFFISEVVNDLAPIGWSYFIPLATLLHANYKIERVTRDA